LLVAHGTPYSDITGVFTNSREALFRRLDREYGDDADVMILGHTHTPLNARTSRLRILNAGAVYGVTMRDSHTCGVLHLPTLAFYVYDLRTGDPVNVSTVIINTTDTEE
jgi:predicted phosphodiesterase